MYKHKDDEYPKTIVTFCWRYNDKLCNQLDSVPFNHMELPHDDYGWLFIYTLFDFRTEDVTDFFISVSSNTGISPHWIHAIRIGNFSTHINALLLNTLFISLLIYVTGWLKKIIKGSRFLSIVSSLTLLATLLY